MKKSKHDNLDYNQINKYIFIGTNQCCQVHFDNGLRRKGIKADISLEKVRIDAPFGVDYYLWLPTSDHHAPSNKQLFIGARTLMHLASKKIKVYIHCKNGHGRAPSLVAAYLILTGMKLENAIKFLKKKRRVVHLNDRQIKALKQFERNLKRK